MDLFPPRPFDIPVWNYPEHYGYNAAQMSAVWESVKNDPKFWLKLGPYPEASAALAGLNGKIMDGDDVYFITSRLGVEAKSQTESWLRLWGFENIPTVLISSAKGLCAQALKLDLYIDDRWENAVDVAGKHEIIDNTVTWVQSNVLTCLIDRPWNQGKDHERYGIVRVRYATDVLD